MNCHVFDLAGGSLGRKRRGEEGKEEEGRGGKGGYLALHFHLMGVKKNSISGRQLRARSLLHHFGSTFTEETTFQLSPSRCCCSRAAADRTDTVVWIHVFFFLLFLRGRHMKVVSAH